MLHRIVRWFRKPQGKPKSEGEIEQERKEALDEAIQEAGRLKKLSLSENSGWKDFCLLVNDYIDKLLQRKIVTRLDTSTAETKRLLELNDRDIATLQWVLQIPQQFVEDLESKLAEEREKEKKSDE